MKKLTLTLTCLLWILAGCSEDSSSPAPSPQGPQDSPTPAPEKEECWFKNMEKSGLEKLVTTLNQFNDREFGLNTYKAIEAITADKEEIVFLESALVTQKTIPVLGLENFESLAQSDDLVGFYRYTIGSGKFLKKMFAENIQTCNWNLF